MSIYNKSCILEINSNEALKLSEQRLLNHTFSAIREEADKGRLAAEISFLADESEIELVVNKLKALGFNATKEEKKLKIYWGG